MLTILAFRIYSDLRQGPTSRTTPSTNSSLRAVERGASSGVKAAASFPGSSPLELKFIKGRTVSILNSSHNTIRGATCSKTRPLGLTLRKARARRPSSDPTAASTTPDPPHSHMAGETIRWWTPRPRLEMRPSSGSERKSTLEVATVATQVSFASEITRLPTGALKLIVKPCRSHPSTLFVFKPTYRTLRASNGGPSSVLGAPPAGRVWRQGHLGSLHGQPAGKELNRGAGFHCCRNLCNFRYGHPRCEGCVRVSRTRWLAAVPNRRGGILSVGIKLRKVEVGLGSR